MLSTEQLNWFLNRLKRKVDKLSFALGTMEDRFLPGKVVDNIPGNPVADRVYFEKTSGRISLPDGSGGFVDFGGNLDGYNHVQVADLPAPLAPNTVYFVANGGKVVVTDSTGNPTEYGGGGGKDYWQFGFYGQIVVPKGTIPSGNDRYKRLTNSYNSVVKWNWGTNIDSYVFQMHITGWHLPPGYKFRTLRVNGGYIGSAVINNWSIYLYKGVASHNHLEGHGYGSGDWLVGVFPIDMEWSGGNIYRFTKKYDISNLNIVTGEDEIYYMLIAEDNPTSNADMNIRNGAIIFELEK